ncbi:MAG: PmbA/TldA family metallopeptidase, partial [Actinomycetota bacterium]
MIDNDVLERVLATALTTGADFAEIFASDWRGTGVGLDDGRVEQLSTGRSRGAGIRVIKGD